ncbi:hypothetical protein R1sor_003750 [Riccia sorocarpa]|uniref:Uncharacterized protein n=1 Tax=Riccia sorocarpa TaxID=122646 RepID=A0ABD3H2I3_9MARC
MQEVQKDLEENHEDEDRRVQPLPAITRTDSYPYSRSYTFSLSVNVAGVFSGDDNEDCPEFISLSQLQAPAPRQGGGGGRGRPGPVTCYRCGGPHYANQCTEPRPPRCVVCTGAHTMAECPQFRNLLRDDQQPPAPPQHNANVNFIAVVEGSQEEHHQVNHIADESVFVTTRSRSYRLPPVQEEHPLSASESDEDYDPQHHPVPRARSVPGEEDPALQMYRTVVPLFNTLAQQPPGASLFEYDILADLANTKSNVSVKQLLEVSPVCQQAMQHFLGKIMNNPLPPVRSHHRQTMAPTTTTTVVPRAAAPTSSTTPTVPAPGPSNMQHTPLTTSPLLAPVDPSSSNWTETTPQPASTPTSDDNTVSLHMIRHRDPVVPVTIDGHLIPDCRIDSGSSVNVITLDTMRALGLTNMLPTATILRMADGRNIRPVGELKSVHTLIGEQTYLVNYIVMDMSHPAQFPVLLGVPWLIAADVHTSWRIGKLTFGPKKNQSTLLMY